MRESARIRPICGAGIGISERERAGQQSKLIKPTTGESVGPVSHANPAQSVVCGAPGRQGDLKNRMPTVNCPII